MKLVFIIGDAAVGKMTVGQELAKITDLRLFHNHMTIEPVLSVFGEYNGRTTSRLREVIFEEFAATDKYGLIFTYMWAFNEKSDWDYIEHVKSIFKDRAPFTEFYYIELVATQNVRLERNVSENRLKNKESKNNIEFSRKILLDADKKYRCESLDGEIPFDNYIKIDNSELSAEAAAELIKKHFSL